MKFYFYFNSLGSILLEVGLIYLPIKWRDFIYSIANVSYYVQTPIDRRTADSYHNI